MFMNEAAFVSVERRLFPIQWMRATVSSLACGWDADCEFCFSAGCWEADFLQPVAIAAIKQAQTNQEQNFLTNIERGVVHESVQALKRKTGEN
jgi:hypothetical protein